MARYRDEHRMDVKGECIIIRDRLLRGERDSERERYIQRDRERGERERERERER